MNTSLHYLLPILAFLTLLSCSKKESDSAEIPVDKSYAIYAEYAKANVIMKDGVNRRKFDTVEAQHGSRISLDKDGYIILEPGTYSIRGFSMVIMQNTTAPPAPQNNNTYPGYCLVYYKRDEGNSESILRNRIGIGSGATAMYMAPSTFDLVFTCKEKSEICVGHQVGDTLHNEVYFTLDDIGDGKPSPYHVFGRIAISEL